ncbi:contact-dependent growth inhibition system immunity protein [Nocardioides renjunii]|uniref:contact-dependent growth inhibition system immunity protein n=1 Tax=Nocardioides renjunii TaxID=3095075 RepID=UPI002AFF96A8|nr:contact-dependent growth inhibition system immunity protein [Nocardioides sp. S-34]WQQ21639.1 contact-dependent growth inhibition system immunity protein [Nocardioides sp. S-34]
MDDAAHLFSAYFYEDWDEAEYSSWEAAVDDFALRSPGRVAGAAHDIRTLLSLQLADAELGLELRELGCSYSPPEGDQLWLELVRDRLERIATR